MIPLAAEAWPAIFGGLIPIVGLAAIGWLIWHAVKDDPDDDREDHPSQRGSKQPPE